ncbi:Hsp20/alpha crystallin family protein [Halobellus ordinarius]|uniref:Hsp20/alpha crystallin family protein n=1 Tax=Halobellus ordinarius TaxID=3075120 RepID=UPI0028800CC0|nr:Hsp20 family protein [Halobellus sp. ZY16]
MMRRTPDFDEFEFEDLFARMTRQLEEMSHSIDGARMFGRGTAIDLREEPEAFVVAVDVPGFEKSDIELAVADRVLTIEASRDDIAETTSGDDIAETTSGDDIAETTSGDDIAETAGDDDEVGHYVRRERHTDSIRRSVRLPGDVRADDASATYRNGVLTVTLPKLAADADDAQRIDVE